MNWLQQYFLLGPMPQEILTGQYNLNLVFLSYLIASLTSYVALDMSSHLKRQNSKLFRISWWFGGAIVMGAGIWSMHFIGMLAFKMDMPMTYDIFWTSLSMLVATIAAGLAFLFFMIKNPRPVHYLLSGITLGIAIPAMHYLGMAGMENMHIQYIPSIFALSILVAIIAATAAVWLAAHSDKGTYARRVQLKVISALIMGVAIAGMHYTGMFAAVFIPDEHMVHSADNLDPTVLAIIITTIIISIMSIAIILSNTKYYVTTKIQNEKDFLEVVLNNLRGGVMAFDDEKRLRLYNNTIGNMFTNLELGENYSNKWSEMFPLMKVENKKPYIGSEHPLTEMFAGEKIKGLEVVLLNSENKERIYSLDGQMLFGREDENLGTVIVFQDITDRKQIDQMKNEFISTVSHELRTPLTSIRGSLGLIIGGAMGEVPKAISPLLEIACNNSERLVRLINDILDTEKIEAGKMIFHFSKNDLSKLIEQAVTDNKSYAEKYKVTYKISQLVPGVQVLIDPDRIRQVVDNLLSNAAKFSKAGGSIDVSMTKQDKKILVSITDNGSGIPEEFQSRIFSKFYQADSSDVREKGGTGLGLSICKSIIESHSGTIGFKSTPNVGTTFYFELLEAPVETTSSIEASESSSLANRILICEDDPDVSKLLGLILRERGFSSVRVATIAEAKKVLETQSFSLMTLDLMLPDGNGLELLKWMRTKKDLEKLPVVVVSAVSIEQEKVKGSALGIVDWIDKPIDEQRLYKDVVQVLGTTNKNLKPRVLHVEDDSDIAKIVATVLTDVCNTDVTSTVANAKKLLVEIKYDLIILDLNLKDGSGCDVLTFLEENGNKIPVVILSVDEAPMDVSQNIAASLVKSKVSNADLLEKIVSIIEHNQAKAEENKNA